MAIQSKTALEKIHELELQICQRKEDAILELTAKLVAARRTAASRKLQAGRQPIRAI